MSKDSIILATSISGNEITLSQVRQWMADGNKYKLADFLYERLYGRYLKPFDFDDSEFTANYKSGFSIMANSCLLIETYASFKEKVFYDTNGKSERCFGWFFSSEDRFKEFSKNGLATTEYKDLKAKLKNRGLPRDFYRNVRCGILHNAETRNGWKIARRGEFFDMTEKRINATKFLNRLKNCLKDFSNDLRSLEMTDPEWQTLLGRLNEIIIRA